VRCSRHCRQLRPARFLRVAARVAPVRLPLLAFTVAAGVYLSEHTGRLAAAPGPWISALALVVISGLPQRSARVRWLLTAILLGGAAASWRHPVAPRIPPGATVDDREPEVLIGVIHGPTTLVADRIGSRLVTDDGLAVWMWAPPPLAPGDRVAVTGRLRTPRGYRNPGEVDRGMLAHLRGVDLELSVIEIEHLAVTGDVPWRWADATRRRWSRTIAHAAPAERATAAAIVRGAVVGDRSAIGDDTDDAWRAAGVYHVLSVSGLHLAVVALLGFAVLRRAIAGLGLGRSHPPARYAALPALIAAAAYTAITGAEVATLRALLVVAIVLAGAALARPVRIGDAIAAAAIALLVHRPASIHDPSFQLSFVAAAVLAALPARVPGVDHGRLRRFAAAVGRGLVASAWVTAATAPLTASAFGQIAWGGIVGNLIVTPVIELVVIPVTLFGLAGAAIVPALGTGMIAAAVVLTDLIDQIIAGLATATPSLIVIPPSTAELVGWTCAWLVPFQIFRRRWRARPALALTAIILVAAVGLRLARHHALRHPDQLVITFLDVGQGDAAVIETPAGETWLVDAGGEPGAERARAVAPGTAVARFLANRGRDRLDVVVVSHPHPDHYLGLLALVDRVAIGTVLVAIDPAAAGATCGDGLCFAAVLDRLRAAGARVVVPPLGVAWSSGATGLEVLAPRYRPVDPPLVAGGDPVRSVNDNSLVVAVTHAGRRVVFLGDLEEEGELELAAAGLARGDVVKVAHHGSATSSTVELVAATGASLAVISCGRANRFDFPRASTLERWTAAGARIARTDVSGAITVSIDAAGAMSTTTR
jgi:competence protein ComEC